MANGNKRRASLMIRTRTMGPFGRAFQMQLVKMRAAQLMPENADYLFEAQSLANKAGNYALGLHYAQDMLALAKRDGEDSLAYARAANEVASNLNAQGRYAEAEPLYRKGLDIWERVLGPDHPSTATSYN